MLFNKNRQPKNQLWNVLKLTTAHDVTITMYRVVESRRRCVSSGVMSVMNVCTRNS